MQFSKNNHTLLIGEYRSFTTLFHQLFLDSSNHLAHHLKMGFGEDVWIKKACYHTPSNRIYIVDSDYQFFVVQSNGKKESLPTNNGYRYDLGSPEFGIHFFATSGFENGNTIAAVSDGLEVAFVNVDKNLELFRYQGSSRLRGLCLANDTNLIALRFADGSVNVINLLNGFKLTHEIVSKSPAITVAFGPQGKQLAIGHSNGAITIHDLEPASEKKTD